jgi:signal transduction histidine kinase
MRLVPKLYLSFGILLAISLGSAAVAISTAREASFHLQRTHLAHEQYESFLALSNHTYQLFKQFGDAMLIGDRDQGAGETALIKEIRKDIATIRNLTAQEIQLVGEEEIEELDRLAAIEKHIESLLAEYKNLVETSDRTTFPTHWSRLSHVLDEKVDHDFNVLIEEALADEAGEVSDTRAGTKARLDLLTFLAWMFGIIAVVAAAASLSLLVRNIRKPIEKLLVGAEALAGGRLDHRIKVQGGSELDDVANAFNSMAVEISTREAALSQSKDRLERAVADRTAELERVLDQLRITGENRKRLLADVSHELRTPLTIIRGEADIALRGGLKKPEIYREALEKTRDAAMHTAGLVDDLLFVARHEASETRLKLEEVDLSTLVPKIVEQHRAVAQENNAHVTFVNYTNDATVRGDAGRIGQVILILLENARRYGGSSIELRLDTAPAGFAISVSDNGPGMDESEQPRAFERFFRGSNAASRYDQGVGLGLPMAKSIVESHGGEIALKSSPGEGLMVSFTLPKRPKLEAVS